MTSLGYDAFYVSEIESVIWGNGITDIPFICFSSSSVKSVVISDSVKTIASSAFYNCWQLETLVIGSGVESIADSVLKYTDNLSVVHYNGTQEEWDAIEIDADNTDENGLLTKEIHFVEQKDGVDPTCKVEGHTAGLYCSDCESYVTGGEAISDLLEHTPDVAVDENIVAAGCETAGTKDVVVYCAVCGDELSRETVETEPKKGHSFDDDCDTTCNNNDCEHTRTITHDYSTEWSKNETHHWHECACGDKADEAEHSFGEWTVTKQATATEAGEKKRTCVCGAEETEAIPAIGSNNVSGDNSSQNGASGSGNVSSDNSSKDDSTGGCGNSLSFGSTVGVGLIGFAAVLVARKKKKEE